MTLTKNTLHFNVTKKYAFELTLLNKVRKFSDGIDWFELSIKTNLYKADHNPSNSIVLTILNVNLIEMLIYNKYHEGEDYYGNR